MKWYLSLWDVGYASNIAARKEKTARTRKQKKKKKKS